MNYGEEVLTLFREAAHAGTVAGGMTARASGRSGSTDVVFSALAAGGSIQSIRYGALGCPWVIAACEWVCREAEGAPVALLDRFAAAALVEVLDAPVEKTGSLLVVEDALLRLRVALEGKG